MRTTTFDPLGIEIRDLDLKRPSDDDVHLVRRLLAEHGVAVFPDQTLDDSQFLQFLQRFGDMVFTKGETPLPGFADLNAVTNVGRTTPPRSEFHVDTSYVRQPPSYTSLRAVEIPTQGGETVFSNQYRAFDTLPLDVKRTLEGRRITHVVTGVDLGDDDETSAEHPVFRVHPLSGRAALYLSTPARCASISGLDDSEAREMVQFLYAHSTRPENLYRHVWRQGDVVMWDNGCVLHRADHSGVVGDRVMHRGMVSGYTVDESSQPALT